MTTAQAVSWLLNARRRMLNIARNAPGAGRAVALTWLDQFEAAVRAARARGETEHDIPLTSELGPAAQAAADREYLAGLVPRESGDSIPARRLLTDEETAWLEPPPEPGPPVLNKSGGSTSEGPWPLCAARVGCLVRVEVEGSYCRKHGGAGPW